MKGHILIMLANILFGASMPVFKYLLTADVPPEAITHYAGDFRLHDVLVGILFHAERKSPAERFMPTFRLRSLWSGDQPMVVCHRVEKFFACQCFYYRHSSTYFRIATGCPRA